MKNKWWNKFTEENLLLHQVYSPTNERTGAWGSCMENLPDTWPGQVYRVSGVGRTLCKSPKVLLQLLHLTGLFSPHLDVREWKLPSSWEKTPMGYSAARRHFHSRDGDRSRWGQSPSPQHLSRHQSPSPSPPQSHLANECLCCFLKDLNLYTRPHESRSRAWRSDAPTLAEKPKKQVRFEAKGDLGDDPTLALDLTLFLAEGLAEEWDNTPGTVPEESLQLPPSKGPQYCPCHTGGVRPKALAHPTA